MLMGLTHEKRAFESDGSHLVEAHSPGCNFPQLFETLS